MDSTFAPTASRTEAPTPAPITMGDLVDVFLELHVSRLKHPAPVRTRLKKYFGPLRPRPLATLTVLDLERWANSIRLGSKAQAVNSISLLRTIYKKAALWNLYQGPNLAALLYKGRIAPRKRVISVHERPALLAALARCSVELQCYVGLIYQTGCRPGEAALMRVADLALWPDGECWRGNWTKPITKTGDAHTVPIPSTLATLLAEWLARRRGPSPYLFPGRDGLQPHSKTYWHALWNEVRRQAGLADVRLHDLRRSCSTELLNSGMDLLTLSRGVLNHASLDTTRVYALPDLERVRLALEARAQQLDTPSKRIV